MGGSLIAILALAGCAPDEPTTVVTVELDDLARWIVDDDIECIYRGDCVERPQTPADQAHWSMVDVLCGDDRALVSSNDPRGAWVVVNGKFDWVLDGTLCLPCDYELEAGGLQDAKTLVTQWSFDYSGCDLSTTLGSDS